eukprot:m.264985 g.264985  ORF g.264985 m.264985 type:complete len:544 (-) comp26736_c0_seq1:234-1865(-)
MTAVAHHLACATKMSQQRSRPGDWNCQECGASVFASKDVCYRCHSPRSRSGGPSTGGGGGGQRRGADPDQWLAAHSVAHAEWTFHDRTARTVAEQRLVNDRDLDAFLRNVPDGGLRDVLTSTITSAANTFGEGTEIKEVYLAEGRLAELIFVLPNGSGKWVLRSDAEVTADVVHGFKTCFDTLPPDARRSGIPGTLHRISRIVHAVTQRTVGITARIGRSIEGQVFPMLMDPSASPLSTTPDDLIAPAVATKLVEWIGRGLMIVGPPNVGKTTVLREFSRVLSLSETIVVAVVDKSLEIAGISEVPHPAIGNARVLTVGGPNRQAKVMLEAVENQGPDILVVDELSDREEAKSCHTITTRGVAAVATVHGETIAQIMFDKDRNQLLGGIEDVTLGAAEARARPDGKKQVMMRKGKVVFQSAIEIRGFTDWVVHEDLERTVSLALEGKCFPAFWHRVKKGKLEKIPVVGRLTKGGDTFDYFSLQCQSREKREPCAWPPTDFDRNVCAPDGAPMWVPLEETTGIYRRTTQEDVAAAARAKETPNV